MWQYKLRGCAGAIIVLTIVRAPSSPGQRLRPCWRQTAIIQAYDEIRDLTRISSVIVKALTLAHL